MGGGPHSPGTHHPIYGSVVVRTGGRGVSRTTGDRGSTLVPTGTTSRWVDKPEGPDRSHTPRGRDGPPNEVSSVDTLRSNHIGTLVPLGLRQGPKFLLPYPLSTGSGVVPLRIYRSWSLPLPTPVDSTRQGCVG